MVTGRRHVAVPRHPAQQSRPVQQPVHPRRRVPEQRELLLQINIDPAEKYRRRFTACQDRSSSSFSGRYIGSIETSCPAASSAFASALSRMHAPQ